MVTEIENKPYVVVRDSCFFSARLHRWRYLTIRLDFHPLSIAFVGVNGTIGRENELYSICTHCVSRETQLWCFIGKINQIQIVRRVSESVPPFKTFGLQYVLPLPYE